jgi:hypothetical protein
MLIPSFPQRSVTMPRLATLKSSVRAVVVAAILANPFSSANATTRQDTVAVFPELPAAVVQDQKPILLTSRTPWVAPVGHRQPRQADVPQHEAVSHWEHLQLQEDQELDSRLVICGGC